MKKRANPGAIEPIIKNKNTIGKYINLFFVNLADSKEMIDTYNTNIEKNKIVKSLLIKNTGAEIRKIINKKGKNNSNLCLIKFLIEVLLKNDFNLSFKLVAVKPLAYL